MNASPARRVRADRVRLHAALTLVEAARGHRHVEREVERLEQGEVGTWSYAERRRLRELVFGATRLRGRYDHLIAHFARRQRELDPRVRAILHVALHEICETRAPDFAVVDQAVQSTRSMGLRWAEGFVNGLLRSVLRQSPRSIFAGPEQDPAAYASTWLAHPRWLVDRWIEHLGPTAAIALCEAQNRRPTLLLRAAPGQREQLLEALRSQAWEGRAVDFAPDAVEMITRVPPAVLLEVLGAQVAIQDAAAQLVAPLLDEPGVVRAADVCAAPGGKAIHLAECLGPESQVLALDLSASRLHSLRSTLGRRGSAVRVQPLVADGRRPCLAEGCLDAVLVDAPCTGTGVLARRHEARWLRQPADLQTLPELQTELLHRAVDLVRPGGWIVYATCSLEPEENDEVVDRVLVDRDDVVEVGVGHRVPADLQSEGRLRVWPHRHRADGAFAARLRRHPIPDDPRPEGSAA